ncbi:MAG: phosphoenolpyruvate-utilizing N-terminal domain-containing protein, partial [Bacillota bacterium]
MSGIIVLKGIGIGKCQLVQDIQYKIRENLISSNYVQEESDLFEASKSKAQTQIEMLRQHALEQVGEEESEIFEAHLMMLDDPMYLDAIRGKITNDRFAAEKAVLATRDELTAMFSQIDNEYIRERAKDIEDVSNRLLDIILGVNSNPLEHIVSATVVVAKDLKPS